MAGIFTRKEIAKIMADENLTPEERTDQVFSLYGRALDDGYITRGAAEAAQTAALEAAKKEWEKSVVPVNVLETPEYKELKGEYEGYKAKESARGSDDFKDVKPKFFDTVYERIDRSEGAKPISEQIAGMKKDFEEYFNQPPAQPTPPAPKPLFGAKPEGSMPTGQEGAVEGFGKAWGFAPRKS